jgi:hypothetical protein
MANDTYEAALRERQTLVIGRPAAVDCRPSSIALDLCAGCLSAEDAWGGGFLPSYPHVYHVGAGTWRAGWQKTR